MGSRLPRPPLYFFITTLDGVDSFKPLHERLQSLQDLLVGGAGHDWSGVAPNGQSGGAAKDRESCLLRDDAVVVVRACDLLVRLHLFVRN